MSVTRINYFEARPGLARELRDFLVSIQPLIAAAPGCEDCKVLHDHHHPDRYIVLERWASEAAHKESVKLIPPEKFGAIKGLLAAPPTGSYYSEEGAATSRT